MSNNNLLYCSCCNYQANFQSEFNKHLKSQKHGRKGKPKEINCDACDYIATTNWNLKIHKVIKHYTPEQKKELKYYCHLCDSVVFSKLYYDNHLNSTLHKNNLILENMENTKNGELTGIKLYKKTKQQNKTNIELVVNNNDISQIEINLKKYIKELLDEMKLELIEQINKNMKN